MVPFEVDRRILEHCRDLGSWRTIRILLNRDSAVRWFILVPETDAGEWYELSAELRNELDFMAGALGRMLREECGCDKINIAAVGNVVPQFHFHVVGRWVKDPYWPDVVWGKSTIKTQYSEEEVVELRKRCFDALKAEA